MKYSNLFAKTTKDVSSEEVSANSKFLVQGGFVDQLAAGIYTWLPLGLRVLNKVDNIIREEMDAIGGNEVTMPTLIPKNNWLKTDRWENVDVLFKTKSQTESEYGLGFSHEEVVTPLAAKFIKSYKDLPVFIYQIQTKFRDELRAKSGVLRGREFGMKDLYSFHSSEEDLARFYEDVKKAYFKVFKRVGLTDVKITDASGGSFTKKLSHEFNVLTPSGEVDLLYCDLCTFAQNEEVATTKKDEKCPNCKEGKILFGKAIEVGNIFDLGEKFAHDFNLVFTTSDGSKKPVVMGCYGIGDTRVVGTIVELWHDERGIIWPKSVSPYDVYLVSLEGENENAKKVYEGLNHKGIDVLWDDRNDVSAGEKFADCDLIGIPIRLVVSKKTGNGMVEWKERDKKEVEVLSVEDALKKLL